MTRFETVIIGAGPAGSVAATLLAKAGQKVALVEKVSFPRRKVCGEFISAATLPLLDECGVGRDFVAMAGPPVRRVALYAGRAMTDAPLPAQSGRALGREHLDTLLRDAAVAAGADLFQPAELTAIDRLPDGYRLGLGGQYDLHARRVVAATGSWRTIGPFTQDLRPKPWDLLAFKGHFRHSHLPEGLMPLLAFPGGYGGMVHSDDGRVSLSCCIRRSVLSTARQRHGGRAGEAVIDHIAEHTMGAARALKGAVLDDVMLAAGPIRPGMRARYHDSIFFTGNLAGEAHPVIAEGISMAIQSSALLAQILIAEPNDEAAGARYAKDWQRRFAPRIHASALLAKLAMSATTREAAAMAVKKLPALLTWGARLAGKAA